MRAESVEIYSDATNAAVMRHPGRRFPGVLVQGDTLCSLWKQADLACREAGPGSRGFEEISDLRNRLRSLLDHYKIVLGEHDIPLPFSDQ